MNILMAPGSGSGHTRHVSHCDNREARPEEEGRAAFLLQKGKIKDKKPSLLRGTFGQHCIAILANTTGPSDLQCGDPSYPECKHGFMEVMHTIWKERAGCPGGRQESC